MFTTLGNSIPRNGLVGEWLLDGNVLDTGGTNNGTNTNGIYEKTYRGYQAQSWKGNGSNTYITASSNGNLNGDFTISGWFNALTQTNPAGDIFNFGIDNFSIYLRQHNTSGGYTLLHPTIQWNASQYTEYNLPSRMNLGWTFFTMTVNRTTNKFQYQQKGVFQNELTIAGIGTFNNSMNIGQNTGNNYRFNGNIQGIRLYNRVLSQDEIQLLYLEGQKLLGPTNIAKYPKLFEGLVGYWDFKGTAHNLVNGLLPSTNTANLTIDRFGYSNSAYSFNGSSAIGLSDPTTYNFGTGSFAISMWIVPQSGASYQYPLIRDNSGASPRRLYAIEIQGTSLQPYLYDSGNGGALQVTYTITYGQLYHIVFQRNRTSGYLELYVNGTNVSQIADNGARNMDVSGGLLNIGGITTSYSTGRIDDVSIFNKALSATEVANLYTLTSTDYIYPNPSYDLSSLRDGLLMQLNGTNNGTTTLYDSSGNGINGTVSSTPVYKRQGKVKTISLSSQYISWTSTSFTTSTCFEKVSGKWSLQVNPAYITTTGVTSGTREITDIRLYNRALTIIEQEQLKYSKLGNFIY